MRRLSNIIIWSIGVMAMLIAPMIPHHHHGEVVCTIMERCEMDDVVNDEHTEHHGNQHGEGCTSCDKSAQWVDIKTNNQRHIQDIYLLPLLTLFGYEWHMEDIGTSAEKQAFRRSMPYDSTSRGRTHGLRAPPRFTIS
ncbi:MAG: DUF6769 family protein [Prevotella sp.]